MGGENNRLSPCRGSVPDAKLAACGGASKGLLIHCLWVGSGGVDWCPGHLYQPWSRWQSHMPLSCVCCHLDVLRGKVGLHSCYGNSILCFTWACLASWR